MPTEIHALAHLDGMLIRFLLSYHRYPGNHLVYTHHDRCRGHLNPEVVAAMTTAIAKHAHLNPLDCQFGFLRTFRSDDHLEPSCFEFLRIRLLQWDDGISADYEFCECPMSLPDDFNALINDQPVTEV